MITTHNLLSELDEKTERQHPIKCYKVKGVVETNNQLRPEEKRDIKRRIKNIKKEIRHLQNSKPTGFKHPTLSSGHSKSRHFAFSRNILMI